MPLDVPTLFTISTCVTAVLGLFLLFAWIQDRSIRALAWWAAAYLLGGLAAAMWNVHDAISRALTIDVVFALMFVACGIIWNGARLFHARRVLPVAMFSGAILWLFACQSPVVHESDSYRIMLGSAVIASYILLTAFELWRERGEQLFSRWPAVAVLFIHSFVFMLPIPLVLFLPYESGVALAAGWFPILALETLLFAIGTAFIILVMAEGALRPYASGGSVDRSADRNLQPSRILRGSRPADPQAGMEEAARHRADVRSRSLQVGQRPVRSRGRRRGVVPVRPHGGAQPRASDVIGRLGGEEFVAVLPSDLLSA